jgi:hypothetical protein
MKFLPWILLLPLMWPVEGKAEHTPDGREILEQPAILYSNSSEAHRLHKTHVIQAGAGLLVGSLTYGYFLHSDFLLTATLQRQFDFMGGADTQLSLGTQHFFGDAFYIKPALAGRYSRAVAYENTLLLTNTSPQWDSGIDFSLGHQWSSRSLVWSAEWVGFYLPLFKKAADGTQLELRLLQLRIGLAR